MPLDPQYLDAIKGFEGYTPTAQWDYKQNSNGYGTKALYPGETIDQPTADQRFQTAVDQAQAHVEQVAPNAPPGVKAALTSLTYNAGPGWANSGLGDLVRAGDWEGAAQRFQEYNKAGGQVNPGLVSRRSKEAAWFGAPQDNPQIPIAGGAPMPPAAGPVAQPSMPAFAFSPGAQAAAPQQQAQYQPQAEAQTPTQEPPAFRFDPYLLDPDRPNALMKKIALSSPALRRGFSFRG